MAHRACAVSARDHGHDLIGRDYQDVTIVKCSQSAGSEALINAIGYYIDQEPSSILVIQPNVKPMAKDFSKDRLAPMVRDCARLRGKVKDPRARDSGNTILHKEFPGGHCSPSPARTRQRASPRTYSHRARRRAGSLGRISWLGRRPARPRRGAADHVPAPEEAVKVSSPGNEGESRAEKEWKLTDQRHYYVPCPHCGHEQPLEWRDSGGKPDIKPGTKATTASRGRRKVDGQIVHKPRPPGTSAVIAASSSRRRHKHWMLRNGRWVKHNPTSKYAGFHISGLSPDGRPVERARGEVARGEG
jgi:phage terminase large subunit GpA-like protein